MSAPFISVCVPAHNRADLVAQTLDSVLAQTETAFELIAFDDGSTDDTLRVLRDYEARDPRISAHTHENAGVGDTRNAAARLARGEYLLMLDSDDLLTPWALASFREAVERSPEPRPAIVAGPWLPFHRRQTFDVLRPAPVRTRAWKDYLATRARASAIAPSATIVRADVYREIGGCATSRLMFEDLDVWLRAGERPGFVQIDEPVVAGYRVGHESRMRDMTNTLDGFRWILRRARDGVYARGRHPRELRGHLAANARWGSFRCLRCADRRRAWAFYRHALGPNARLGRVRYLLGFPLIALTTAPVRAEKAPERAP